VRILSESAWWGLGKTTGRSRDQKERGPGKLEKAL